MALRTPDEARVGAGKGRRLVLAWILLAAICGVSFFWQLGANGIWDLDEALYTESAREMRLSGDYVTPRVNGQPFFEKPPLIYWEAAASFAVLGKSELAARLPSALASTALTALIFLTGSRIFGRRSGLLASVFFALSPLVFGTTRQLTTDATLDLCITTALLSLVGSQLTGSRRSTVCGILFWAVCGLGVLAKGLPGILIPAVVGFLYLGFACRWERAGMARGILRLLPVPGLAVFLAIALPWHILAWQQSGQAFVHEYIVVQHLARFRGGDTAHLAPFWFFVPGFLAGFFPLSAFLPAALLERRDAKPAMGEEPNSTGDDRPGLFRLLLKVWAVTVFVMFSASGSKLVSYILPMYPPAAMLIGDWCSRACDRDRSLQTLHRGAGVLFVLTALLLAVLLFRDSVIAVVESMSHRPVRMDAIPAGTFAWAAHLLLVLAASTGIFGVLVLIRRPKPAFGVMAAGMTLFLGIAVAEGLPLLNGTVVAPLQESAAFAGKRAAALNAPLVLYLGPPRRPSALFYLPESLISHPHVAQESRVVEVMDPKDSYGNIDVFLRTMPAAVVVTDTGRVAYLQEHHSMRVVSRRGKWHVLERSLGTQ